MAIILLGRVHLSFGNVAVHFAYGKNVGRLKIVNNIKIYMKNGPIRGEWVKRDTASKSNTGHNNK